MKQHFVVNIRVVENSIVAINKTVSIDRFQKTDGEFVFQQLNIIKMSKTPKGINGNTL